MNPKISVIVPVYNVEEYVEKCVNSILDQTYNDFEIILIDDGSTDRSGEICDSLAETDDRIRVFHKENKGLSHTRNKGVELAAGEFIAFVDSDDIVHTEYLNTLMSLINKYDADISACECVLCNAGEEPYYPIKIYEEGGVAGTDALYLMLSGKVHGTSAWGLLIKKPYTEKYRFPDGKYHEDDMTTYKYFMNANKVAYTKRPLYVYIQRDGSIMHKAFSNIDIDELDAGDQIYDDCKKLGTKFRDAAMVKRTANYSQIMYKFPDLKKTSLVTYERIIGFFDTYLFDILKNKNIGKKQKIKIIYNLFVLKRS